MEILIGIAILGILVYFTALSKNKNDDAGENHRHPYIYSRRESAMTEHEKKFFIRLNNLVSDRYYVFPQVHLSSLAINRTTGKYYKAGFQRINRRSVDYVLADKITLESKYAVELDDKTHDSAKSRRLDELKEKILNDIKLPLIRFRDIGSLSDQDIIEKFKEAYKEQERTA